MADKMTFEQAQAFLAKERERVARARRRRQEKRQEAKRIVAEAQAKGRK